MFAQNVTNNQSGSNVISTTNSNTTIMMHKSNENIVVSVTNQVSMAIHLFHNGKRKNARTLFLQVQKEQPDNGVVLSYLGLMAYMQSDLSSAVQYCHHAVTNLESPLLAHLILADIALRDEDITRARMHYEKALMIDDNIYIAHIRLAEIIQVISPETAGRHLVQSYQLNELALEKYLPKASEYTISVGLKQHTLCDTNNIYADKSITNSITVQRAPVIIETNAVVQSNTAHMIGFITQPTGTEDTRVITQQRKHADWPDFYIWRKIVQSVIVGLLLVFIVRARQQQEEKVQKKVFSRFVK